MSSSRIAYTLFRISISLFLIGTLLKVQHLPYDMEMLNLSLGLMFISYIFRFSFKKEKLFLDYLKLVLVLSWSIQAALHLNHLPYRLPFAIVSAASFIFWFGYEGPFGYFKRPSKSDSFKKKIIPSFLYPLSIIPIVLGALFKLMHWPMAGILLILGFSFLALTILASTFSNRN